VFCSMCRTESNSADAKFCTNCGAEHAPSVPTQDNFKSETLSKEKARQAVFGADAESEAAKEEIIEASDTIAMLECIAISESEELIEFWYGELITAESLSIAERGESLILFVRGYLMPRQRFSEAEFLVEGLLGWDPQFESKSQEIIKELELKINETGTRFELSEAWDNEIYREPLSDSVTGLALFEFMLYRLIYAEDKHNNFFRTLVNPDEDSIYQDFYGYYIGIKQSHSSNGRSARANETFWLSAASHLKILRSKQSIPSNFKYMASRVLELKMPKKFSKDGLKNFNNGSNLTERIYSILSVSEKIGDTTDINQGFLILTSDRIYLYKTSGMLSEGYSKSFWKSDLQSLEIGDSGHQQLSGFTSRNTSWVTISLVKKDGSSMRKHFYLGANSREITPNEKLVKKTILDAIDLGYPVFDGDGIYSQAGYRMSMGFGVITPLD
jgi:hypothetical protein